MNIANQKDKFNLDPEIAYLNHAYMAPQLTSITAVGIENLKKKERTNTIAASDFFEEKEVLRSRFAQLIGAEDPNNIAVIPSVSYGIANALKNIPFQTGDEIIVLEEQFPSHYYAWKELESQNGVIVKTIMSPSIENGRGKNWNDQILASINSSTKVVAIPIVHWADGTKFDIAEIQKAAEKVDAYLIIDGTQSIGALPFSVSETKVDALICGGYKWLMGPYSLGVAYYGKRFENGTPIENNWMNHQGSENFSNLVNYNHELKSKSLRYDVGESSNFILTPMLSEGIRQILEWTPKGIQEYCKNLVSEPIGELRKHGYFIEEDSYRGNHLFGIYLRPGQDLEMVKEQLHEAKVFVSYRGNSIRISPHLYTSEEDIRRLVDCLTNID